MRTKTFMMSAAILATLFAGACSKDETEEEPLPYTGSSYLGTVTVLYNGEDYDNENITVDLSANEPADGTLSMTIHQIRFVPQMPVTVDVSIPTVKYTRTDDGITFSADSVVPYSGVVPVERYLVTGLEGSVKGDDCTFTVNFGAYPTSFNGTVVKTTE